MEYADLRLGRQTVQGNSLFLTVKEVQKIAIAMFVSMRRLLERCSASDFVWKLDGKNRRIPNANCYAWFVWLRQPVGTAMRSPSDDEILALSCIAAVSSRD